MRMGYAFASGSSAREGTIEGGKEMTKLGIGKDLADVGWSAEVDS